MKTNLSEAIDFLNQIKDQDIIATHLPKLIRKKFPNWSLQVIGLVTEQTELRKKAAKKFKHASQMIFTKKSLEQSTSEVLSNFTSTLFSKNDEILDICAGIGGNTIGLQNKFERVTTIEPDPLLNEIHEHNLRLYYPTKSIHRIISELAPEHIQQFSSLFVDPDRRATGKKSFSIEEHSPDIKSLLDNCNDTKEVILKLSPMLNASETERGFSFMYLAEDMELKQNLWLSNNLNKKDFKFAIHHAGEIFTASHLPNNSIENNTSEFLYEMNPAIIKSGESFSIAKKYQLQPLSDGHKHFVGPLQNIYPIANCWKIIAQEPYHPKKITSFLQAQNFDRFEIKPFGIDDNEVKSLINKWGKGQGKAGTVFIFKLKDFKQIIIGDKMGSSEN